MSEEHKRVLLGKPDPEVLAANVRYGIRVLQNGIAGTNALGEPIDDKLAEGFRAFGAREIYVAFQRASNHKLDIPLPPEAATEAGWLLGQHLDEAREFYRKVEKNSGGKIKYLW